MKQFLQLSIPARIALLRLTLCLAIPVSVLFSFRLWGWERDFPHAPLLDGFAPGFPAELILAFVMITLLLLSTVLRYSRLLIFLALLLSAVLVAGDVNRLQPWFYVYGSLLLVLVSYNGRVDNPNTFTSYFILLQIIIASVYFFTGLGLLRSGTEVVSVYLDPISGMVSERQLEFVKRCLVIVPYLLMFTGLGLIITPARYLAVTFGVLFHLLMIILAFPTPLQPDIALWFGNIVFIALLLVLFLGKTKQRYFSPSVLFQRPLFYAVLAVFVLMPFATGFLWQGYASPDFGTNNSKTIIKLTRETYQKLPLYERGFCKADGGDVAIDYGMWCRNELGVKCSRHSKVMQSVYSYLGVFRAESPGEQLALNP